MSWGPREYKASLIKFKSLATMGLKQLEKVQGDEFPDDPELKDNLFAVYSALHDEWERAEEEYPDLCSAWEEAEGFEKKQLEQED